MHFRCGVVKEPLSSAKMFDTIVRHIKNFYLAVVLGITHWIGAIPSKVFSGRT